MLDNQQTVAIGTATPVTYSPRITQMHGANNIMRSAMNTDGSRVFSVKNVATNNKDKSAKTRTTFTLEGNFVDADGNRFDAAQEVEISTSQPAGGFTAVELIDLLKAASAYLQADESGLPRLVRLLNGEC